MFIAKLGWIESEEFRGLLREYGDKMYLNTQKPAKTINPSELDGTNLFVTLIKNISVLYSEINDQKLDFEKTLNSRFLKPLKTFLEQSVPKFNEEKQHFEKARKEHDQSLQKSKQFESQYVLSQQQRPADAEKLIAAEQERYKYDIKYRSILWDTVQEAESVVLERNTSILNAFRSLLMAELSFHRLAEKTIIEKNELLSKIGDYFDSKKHILENQTNDMAVKRAEHDRFEDSQRYEKLCDFVEKYSDFLTGTEIDMYCKSKANDILNSTVNIIDSHNSIMNKLKQDITSTIIVNSGPTLSSITFMKQQPSSMTSSATSSSPLSSSPTPESDLNDATGSKALFSLRSTSSLTRTLTCYSKKCCGKWTSDIFAETLAEIFAKGSSLEIEMKFIEQIPGKSTEEILEENTERFKKVCQGLLDRIRGSTKTFPIQVRELARHMRFEMSRLDGPAAGNLSLSGFIFLRIICPYITGFVPKTSDGAVRRVLLNTAKILQTIANEAMSTVKEAKYSSFVSFITENRALVYKWYDELTVNIFI